MRDYHPKLTETVLAKRMLVLLELYRVMRAQNYPVALSALDTITKHFPPFHF